MIGTGPPSDLSLLAAAFYAIVALVCFLASRAQPGYRAEHRARILWIAVGMVFIVLAGMRVLSLEDFLRDYFRDAIAEHGLREVRRDVQVIILASIALLSFAGAAWSLVRLRMIWPDWQARLRFIASLAIGILAILILVRIVSLHFTDWLLFSGIIGPIRLNWIIDLGASLTVLLCAAMSIKIGRPEASRTRKSVSDYRR